MKIFVAIALFILAGLHTQAQKQLHSAAIQIRTAVLAAPLDKRAGATVYGYDQNGEVVLLRRGSNEIVCLADDPSQKDFSVSAYHKDLEPFMARGRELRKEGKSAKEIFDMREAEAKSGKLKLPKQPATLFVYNAPDANVNITTGEVKNGYLRYVVYIPYATSESTGLPLKPESPAMPWIMYPGTHGAHIMINPPVQDAKNK